MSPPKRQRRALTLVEVLVVVAIVAILLALLLPAIMKVRVYANQLQDAENLRKLGKAWLMYAQTHQGRAVDHKGSDAFDRWVNKLAPYCDDIDGIIISPGDPNRQARLKFMQDNPGRRSTSYVLNPYFATKIDDPKTGKTVSCEKVSHCTSLSNAIIILPVGVKSGVPGAGYIFPQGWFANPKSLAWQRVTGQLGIQPDRFGPGSLDQTLGVSNYLYADGHVEPLSADRIKRLIDEGQNFLIPQK